MPGSKGIESIDMLTVTRAQSVTEYNNILSILLQSSRNVLKDP